MKESLYWPLAAANWLPARVRLGHGRCKDDDGALWRRPAGGAAVAVGGGASAPQAARPRAAAEQRCRAHELPSAQMFGSGSLSLCPVFGLQPGSLALRRLPGEKCPAVAAPHGADELRGDAHGNLGCGDGAMSPPMGRWTPAARSAGMPAASRAFADEARLYGGCRCSPRRQADAAGRAQDGPRTPRWPVSTTTQSPARRDAHQESRSPNAPQVTASLAQRAPGRRCPGGRP